MTTLGQPAKIPTPPPQPPLHPAVTHHYLPQPAIPTPPPQPTKTNIGALPVSSRVGLFHSIGKSISDLLTRDYPSEKQQYKVEWRGRTSTGVTLATSYTTDANGTVSAAIAPSFFYTPLRTAIYTELKTSPEASIVAVTEDAVPGVTTVLTGSVSNTDVYGTAGAEYRTNAIAASAQADIGKKEGSTIKGSIVVGRPDLAIGASVEYLAGQFGTPSGVQEHKVSVAYTKPDFEVVGFHRVDTRPHAVQNIVGASFLHRVNPRLFAGTEFSTDISKMTQGVYATSLAAGINYIYGEDTIIKGKLDTAGQLGLSLLAKRFNSDTQLLLSSTIDTVNPTGKNGSKLGFTLTLGERSFFPRALGAAVVTTTTTTTAPAATTVYTRQVPTYTGATTTGTVQTGPVTPFSGKAVLAP